MKNKIDWLKPADYLSGSVFVAVMLFFSILGCRAQTALYLSRERSQAELTANNLAGLVVYEAKASDANILFVNHAMVKLVSYDDMWDYYRTLNNDQTKFIDPRDEEWTSRKLAKIFTGPVDGQSHELRYRILSKDGHAIPVISVVKLVDNPRYGLIAYQSFIKDRQTEK